MRAVAEQRFGDAQALRKTGENERANGALYLGGFVIEILLKMQLVQAFPSTTRAAASGLQRPHRFQQLVWSSHDLAALLDELPQLEAALRSKGRQDGCDYVTQLKSICQIWTIQARYSSHKIGMKQASDFLDRVANLKEVLK